MSRVFLSHSSADKDRFVEPLFAALKQIGVDVWLDTVELQPGDDLVQRIFDEGIGQSDVVAVVLSKASLKSRWVQQELNASVVRRLTHDTRLVPIILDDVEPPVSLAHLVHINAIASESDILRVARRIADTAFGIQSSTVKQLEPPIVNYVPRIAGLTKIDELLLRLICDEILNGNGHPYVSRDTFIAFADENKLSEEALEESLSALAHAYYIEEHFEIGSRLPFAVKPTHFGFEVYLQNYYSNLDKAYNDVAASIVNDGHFHDAQIAASKTIPITLVDFILESFESVGHVVLIRSMDGIYLNPKPTLRRVLQ